MGFPSSEGIGEFPLLGEEGIKGWCFRRLI